MARKFMFRMFLSVLIFNYWILMFDCLPCKTLPNCQCEENKSVVKCENMMGLSSLTGIKPNVVSLTVTNSFLGPTLNTSFSLYIMEVEDLDLSGSRIHTITVHVFRYLRKLRKLHLQNNFLRILKFEVFAHLNALEYLDLSNNRFEVLPDRPFYSLTSLRVFNISHNSLSHLKFGLRFQVMEHMQVLDLSGNKFDTISEDAFEMTDGWRDNIPKVINLSNCGIKYLEQGAFRNPKGLSTLILKGNVGISIKNLTDLFNSTDSPDIRRIDLSNTSLSDVSNLFLSLKRRNIQELALSHNNITELTSELSENLAGTLHKFDMNHNMLTSLPSAVAKLRNLLYLDLSYNQISDIDAGFDTNLIELRDLNLAYNKIPEGKFTLQNFVQLKNVDLSFNKLKTYLIPNTLVKLHTVNLAGNGIETLGSLDGLTNLENFNFQENKLSVLNMFIFVDSPSIKTANFRGNEIKSVKDSAFNPHSPKHIDLSYNQLTKLKFPGWKNVLTLNLRGNGLKDVDGEAFYALFQLKNLDLAENSLMYIQDKTFTYLTNLTSLHLEHNHLVDLSNWEELFRSLSRLKYLDLGHNNLSRFESSAFFMCKSLQSLNLGHNKIYFVEPSGLEVMKMLESVDFSGNRFKCGCDLIEFRDWLRNSGVQIVHRVKGNFTCHSPPQHAGKDAGEFEVDDFECDFVYLYIVVYSTIGGIFVVVVLITAFVCHYHLKWRRHLHSSEISPSIDFESMETAPFIPDTIKRQSNPKRSEKNKRLMLSNSQPDKEYMKMKKKKLKKNTDFYLMNGNAKHIQNGTIGNGKAGNKTSSKIQTNKRQKKKRRHSDNTYLFRHQNELIIPKPRRKTQSNLELNPYVQQFLWQQHRKQQKNLINKRLNRESFRNVDIIRPVHGSQSSPDFRYIERSRNPVDHGNYHTEVGTWHGSRHRQNIYNSSVDLHQLDNVDSKRKVIMSGYNTISGVPSHRPHAHYI